MVTCIHETNFGSHSSGWLYYNIFPDGHKGYWIYCKGAVQEKHYYLHNMKEALAFLEKMMGRESEIVTNLISIFVSLPFKDVLRIEDQGLHWYTSNNDYYLGYNCQEERDKNPVVIWRHCKIITSIDCTEKAILAFRKKMEG